LQYPNHPEYALWFAAILGLDAITALPFARLRAENRARRFAAIKLSEIAITIALNLLLLWLLPRWQAADPQVAWLVWFQPSQGVAYIFVANLIASGCKTLLLLPQFRGIDFRLDAAVLRPLLAYSLPMVIIGLAGMVNEMLDRVLLKWLLPFDAASNLQQLGIYAACYKLAMVMSLFVQAFRYAGEPFFFAMAGRADAQRAYALVMQGFVATGMLIFLVVTLFLDVFQYFIGAEYRAGLAVVPVLLLANLCLGIYVNLSIWYKLSNRTGMGAWVALLGAAVTVVLNLWWIPRWGYVGSAWATLVCYALMVLVSWLLGQCFYPVRYPLGLLGVYVVVGLALVWGCDYAVSQWHWSRHGAGGLGLAVYAGVLALLTVQQRLARR
jgi:O-antigen/teichoic acid export membrane protein